MNYVLAVSIGPVQDFIAAARRSRDLWFGSWLLSELSKAAAREITVIEDDAGCLVFPSPVKPRALDPGSGFNAANKIVAVVHAERWRGDDGSFDLKSVRGAVASRLDEVRRDAFSQLNIPGPHFRADVASAQVDDLIEFLWAAAPVGEGPDGYKQARDAAERLLAARKATRDFGPVRWGRDVPKSSFDGARESVIDEAVYDLVRRGELSEFQLRRDYGVRPGERLCGVALLKRHGRRGRENRVFSTSHVAAGPLLACLGDKHRERVEKLKAAFADAEADFTGHSAVPEEHPVFGRLDAHLLYAERLKEVIPVKGLESARQALEDFFRETRLPRPGPYYSLLLADGDWMGAAIDAQDTPGRHRDLSRRLAEFAEEAPGLVRRAGGSPVYAGGDDVLAFLPLHTALGCARELADLFAEKMSGFHFEAAGRRASPTLSAGLAVAHHLSPLSDALELARRAEKAAKAVEGKGALAVIVDKRSGAAREVVGRWGGLDERLKTFIGWHVSGEVPDGAAYQLRDLALRLAGVSQPLGRAREALDLAGRYDAVRVLRRKQAGGGAHRVDEGILSRLSALVLTDEYEPGPLTIGALADELIVARVFADAAATAGLAGEGERQ